MDKFDCFIFGFLGYLVSLLGLLFSIWISKPHDKYQEYTEHACVDLRMTHACKVLTEGYKEKEK